MNPDNLKYTRQHEWVRLEGDTAAVGITDYAQSELGDITYVELPAVGKEVTPGDELAVIESVKAASDIYAPVAGRVEAVNDALEQKPEIINEDSYGKGWVCKLTGCTDADRTALMSAEEYDSYVKGPE